MMINTVNWTLILANLPPFLLNLLEKRWQIDVPNEVWGQYPLILIGALLAGWVFKYWVQNEREWREFTTKQVTDQESSNLRVLQLIQSNNEQTIATLERNHAEQLKMQREGLRDAQDAELERILSQLSVGYYEQRPTPTTRKKRPTSD